MQTCRDLYGTTQDRHVWVDQLEKLCRKDPPLRPATPPLTSLSAQELKTFVTGRVKLRLRWDKRDHQIKKDFATKSLVGVSGVPQLRLLPGGKSVLVIDNHGNVALHRIEFKDDQVSLPFVANLKCDQEAIVAAGQSELLTAMSPCPFLVHRLGNK